MNAKVIKTESEYAAAMERIDEIFGAKPDTAEGNELELLLTLVELYEDREFPIDLPSPVAAIRFRMEQQGLKAKDLIPCIGSASKVSEVLAGQRPLSLSMIRKLTTLGIPADVLIQETAKSSPDETLELAQRFPISEMVKRGWFQGFEGTVAEAKAQLEDLIGDFMGKSSPLPALNRQHIRDGGIHDPYALTAWRVRVANLASQERLPLYARGTVTKDLLGDLAQLSYLEKGPLLAREFLNKNGIHLIVERHLPKTHLDGAALKMPDGSPVVALTLRHDRLDNFWFTLFHELAHVALHLDTDGVEAFFDDITRGGADRLEKEADQFASESLIPDEAWRGARLTINSPQIEVVKFARRLRIDPAIPAGRLRFRYNNYKVFANLIGPNRLRPMFGMKT